MPDGETNVKPSDAYWLVICGPDAGEAVPGTTGVSKLTVVVAALATVGAGSPTATATRTTANTDSHARPTHDRDAKGIIPRTNSDRTRQTYACPDDKRDYSAHRAVTTGGRPDHSGSATDTRTRQRHEIVSFPGSPRRRS